MRVTVDHGRCQGHAQCVLAAPELFDLDEADSRASVLADPVPDQHTASARTAADRCPERAIALID